MTKSKGQLCTQFGAYGESLECEPCIFPTTVTLSDEDYGLTTDGQLYSRCLNTDAIPET